MDERDAQTVLDLIRRDFPTIPRVADEIERWPPPLRVIDCVLSLNRRYETVVLPRVRAFAAAHPGLGTCVELSALVAGYPSPVVFLEKELNTHDVRRAATLTGVLEYVIGVQGRFDGPTEAQRLAAWASRARPGDYITMRVRGFGLAGFQYLRMLFGANTVKPDVHITGYVSRAVGQEVSEVEALSMLERAGELGGLRLRDLERVVWRAGGGGAGH